MFTLRYLLPVRHYCDTSDLRGLFCEKSAEARTRAGTNWIVQLNSPLELLRNLDVIYRDEASKVAAIWSTFYYIFNNVLSNRRRFGDYGVQNLRIVFTCTVTLQPRLQVYGDNRCIRLTGLAMRNLLSQYAHSYHRINKKRSCIGILSINLVIVHSWQWFELMLERVFASSRKIAIYVSARAFRMILRRLLLKFANTTVIYQIDIKVVKILKANTVVTKFCYLTFCII